VPGRSGLRELGVLQRAEEGGWLLVGTRIDKMGRTTGWTWGEVTETCVDIPDWFVEYYGPGTSLLCQTEANYNSDPGDSGAPVFTWPLYGDEVTLRGIHVGRYTREDGWVRRLFSDWTWIAFEIGAAVGPLTAAP
jgi:hypothetical protein